MLPQIVMLALLFIGIGIGLSDHGKPKTGENSFWSVLIGQVLLFSILWWGGFFDNIFGG